MIKAKMSDWFASALYWGNRFSNEFKLNSANLIKRQLVATNSMLPSSTNVLELSAFAGPRTLYGLLGATYEPSNGTELVIEFPVCSSISTVDSPLLQDERPRIGFPDWLACGIADSAAEYTARISPPPGIISFCYAAYSDIGSNIYVFEVLAKCILDISFSGIEISTPEQLAAVVRSHLAS